MAVVRPMNSALLNCNRLVVTGAGLQLLTLSWSYISMVTRGGARLMSSLRPCTTTLPNTSSSSQVGDSVSSITWTRRGVKVKIEGVSWGSAGGQLVTCVVREVSHTYSLANGSERPELSSPKTNVYLFCDIDNAMYMHTAGWSHLPSKYNLKCDTFLAETWPGRRGPEAGSTDNKSKGLISILSIYIYLYLVLLISILTCFSV